MGLFSFDVGGLVKDLREAITGEKIKDPTKLAELSEKLQELETTLVKGQLDINKEEAKSTSLFVAGWRPFLGWTAGVAIAYNFIIVPFLNYICNFYKIPIPPTIDSSMLFNLVLGMLGLAGMRTYEKTKGVNNLH